MPDIADSPGTMRWEVTSSQSPCIVEFMEQAFICLRGQSRRMSLAPRCNVLEYEWASDQTRFILKSKLRQQKEFHVNFVR